MNMQPDRSLCYENEFFKLFHCGDCFIAGHLIIHPNQKVIRLFELPMAAQENLGKTLAMAHQVIEQVVQPERIYTLSFCELMPSLHYHLLPRTKEMALAYQAEHVLEGEGINGALMFDWARKKYKTAPVNYVKLIEEINRLFKCC